MEPDRELEKVKIVISFGKKKHPVNSLLSPPEGLFFFQALLRGGGGGGLKERGGAYLI